MGQVRDLFAKLLPEASDEDLQALDDLIAFSGSEPRPADPLDLSEEIPGEAEDAFEVFLANAGKGQEDSDGLMWYPMIRAGDWAVRPGPRGQKVKRKLKIVEGHSKDQRKEIGLADLRDAFDDDAVEYVTVPESHDNNTLENTGFIRAMKIVKAPIASGPNKDKKVATLFGGYDFTELDVKKKVKNGSVAGRSCGILYDYVNTETGKKYPAVIEHVALTNKPWITGMIPFGRKLKGVVDLEYKPMYFSDEDPGDAEGDLLAQAGDVTWTHEDSPTWLHTQINDILETARAQKRKQRGDRYYEDPVPSYRCIEAKSEAPNAGRALIADGWGDGSNHWVAGFSIDDGTVELDEFKQWDAVKNVFIAEDRDPPPKTKEPLDEEPVKNPEDDFDTSTPQGRLALAQFRRREQASGEKPPVDQTTHPRGGEQHMAEKTEGRDQLSEDAREAIRAAEARAAAAEKRAENLERTVDRLSGSVNQKDVDAFIDHLKDIGFSEESGFGGFLTEIRNCMLADDHAEALVSESFSEDGKEEVALSFSDAIKRIFNAVKVGEDGKIALGESLAEPSEKTKDDKPDGGDGKPPKEDSKPDDATAEFSTDPAEVQKRTDELLAENPHLAELVGAPAAKPSEDNSDKGGEGS